MPVIPHVGRRSAKARAALLALYAALAAGAAGMLYPFGLMLAGATKSGVDAPDNLLVPRFLSSGRWLFRKDAEAFFNESLALAQSTLRDGSAYSFRSMEPPPGGPSARAAAALWEEFLEACPPPPHAFELAYVASPRSQGVMPVNLRRFKAELRRRHGSIERLNAALGTGFSDWGAVAVQPDVRLVRSGRPPDSPFLEAYRRFKETRPHSERIYFDIEGYFVHVHLRNLYGRSIAGYNAAHGTSHAAWGDVRLDPRWPADAPEPVRRDWEEFVRHCADLSWIRADPALSGDWSAYLKAKFMTVESLNAVFESSFASFEDVPLPEAPRARLAAAMEFSSFLRGWRDPASGRLFRADIRLVRLDGLPFQFRGWLAARGAPPADAAAAVPPQAAAFAARFAASAGALRWEYATRNLASVFDYVALRGRALLNTALYCALAALGALVVNPLAAYALSRHRPRGGYKALLLLMLTMAFPPMVTQIPVFIMLREFHMLNTFWALILPGLANGYSIFILKSFFDSIPRELYECAALDGAGELRMFANVTLALSGPVMAVTALNAFTAAYSNFMMALLTCQDQSMWTLMPWLYQLQQNSCQGIVHASLALASLPMLLVFTLCQKVMMRGMAVPVEK